ncbi:hypothetical protein SLEP1_g22802 [Rubroshorea leprosula]|uniref:Uncharacterized protein n=1 Tax=Rubroshorea leprosula TaxID=152421 RepID=A0AAV5JAE9_9ROSI|nr:hypothetical protein SLEP1_g22802 [Rubroshorea leprosula]
MSAKNALVTNDPKATKKGITVTSNSNTFLSYNTCSMAKIISASSFHSITSNTPIMEKKEVVVSRANQLLSVLEDFMNKSGFPHAVSNFELSTGFQSRSTLNSPKGSYSPSLSRTIFMPAFMTQPEIVKERIASWLKLSTN